jgi:hypothetical protein
MANDEIILFSTIVLLKKRWKYPEIHL